MRLPPSPSHTLRVYSSGSNAFHIRRKRPQRRDTSLYIGVGYRHMGHAASSRARKVHVNHEVNSPHGIPSSARALVPIRPILHLSSLPPFLDQGALGDFIPLGGVVFPHVMSTGHHMCTGDRAVRHRVQQVCCVPYTTCCPDSCRLPRRTKCPRHWGSGG